jgi:hypothetical protein
MNLQSIYSFYYLAPTCFSIIAIFRELTLKHKKIIFWGKLTEDGDYAKTYKSNLVERIYIYIYIYIIEFYICWCYQRFNISIYRVMKIQTYPIL